MNEMRELKSLAIADFDQATEFEVERALRAEANRVCLTYSAPTHIGKVSFDGDLFVNHVWQHGTAVMTVTGESLREAIEAAVRAYGR